jgi:hypothetical protein
VVRPQAPTWVASIAGVPQPALSPTEGLGAEVDLKGLEVVVKVRPGGPTPLARVLDELHPLGGERLNLHLEAGADPALVMEALGHAGLPDWVRVLCLFTFDDPATFHSAFLDAAPLASSLGQVAVLELQAGGLRLGPLALPRLLSLSLRAGGLSAPVLAQLATLELPRLERLTLWFGSERHGADVMADDVLEFFQRASLPRLRQLNLLATEFTDDLCARLAELPQLPQLETLDLSFGAMTEAGARHLAEAEPRLRHLRSLKTEPRATGPGGVASLVPLQELGGYVVAPD